MAADISLHCLNGLATPRSPCPWTTGLGSGGSSQARPPKRVAGLRPARLSPSSQVAEPQVSGPGRRSRSCATARGAALDAPAASRTIKSRARPTAALWHASKSRLIGECLCKAVGADHQLGDGARILQIIPALLTRPGRAGSPFRSRCHGGSWCGRCSLEQHHDAGGRVIGHRRIQPGGLVAGVLGPVQRLRRSGRGARAVVSVLSANRTVSGRSQFWSRLCAYTRVDCRLQRAGEQRKQTSLHPGRRSSLSLKSGRSAVRPRP